MHEKTSILKTIRKIQKYEQRKKIDKRDGKRKERRLNLTKIDTKK